MAEHEEQSDRVPIPPRETVQRIIIGLDAPTLVLFQSLLKLRKAESATLKRLERKVEKLMAEVDDAGKVLDDLGREVGQIIQLVKDLQAAVSAGAADKALAALVRSRLPEVADEVKALDAFTPEPAA